LEGFSQLTGLSYVITGQRIDLAQLPSDLTSHHNPLDWGTPISRVSEADQEFLDFWEPGLRQKPLIVIDPGHGGRDPGAIGSGGSTEASLALGICLALRQFLLQNGFEVIMTRTEDVYISLQERAMIANEAKADLFVSVHLNSFSDARVRGMEVYFYDYTEQRYRSRLQRLHGDNLPTPNDTLRFMIDHKETTQQYSEIAAKQMVQAFEESNYRHRGIRRGDFAVLAFPTVPSILIECDFLSNPQVENHLRQASGQQEMARMILKGIQKYFRFLDQ
jgi:N-acetylmuramoyl-L-alanine amidase